MSGYKGHLAGALVFFALYFGALAAVFAVDRAYERFAEVELVGYGVALLALCLMFGLWPDVDTNSKGQNLFYGIFFAADLAAGILICVGGALYIAGAVFYGIKRPNFSLRVFGFHELFHAFTVAAFAAHFIAIVRAVLEPVGS